MSNIPLNERIHFVGASEAAALFDKSPYMTRFDLWHIKKGTVEAPNLDNVQRVYWGNILEPAIAEGIAQKEGLEIQNVTEYKKHPKIAGMGASLDFVVKDTEYGAIPFEIKKVDSLIYRKSWSDDEPPLHIKLQVQQQIAVSNAPFGYIGVLIGGNEYRFLKIERHQRAIDKIEQEILAFWESIKNDEEPELTTTPRFDIWGDADETKSLDLSDDEELAILLKQYNKIDVLSKKLKERQSFLKSKVLQKIDDAGYITCGSWILNTTRTRGNPGEVITPEMVGQVIKKRAGYRQFKLKEQD